MTLRYDVSPLGKVERTSSGAARIPAVLSRVGVFSYHDAAGNLVREYRPPEEVHAPESVASLADAPVTVGHPEGGVSDVNWDSVAVGHVRGDLVKKDEASNGIGTKIVVSRKSALEGIAREDAEALRDISPGYSVELDATPGTTPDGQAYDAVQRKIRYNHVALLKRGDGRQGTSVGLRLDSRGNQVAGEAREETPMKIKLRCDGKDIEVEAGSHEHLQIQARIDAEKDSALATSTALVATEKARADVAVAEVAKLKARVDAIDAAEKAKARTALETEVRGVLGAEFKIDAAAADRDLKVAVVKHADASFDPKDQHDAYVQARYDIAIKATRTDASTTIVAEAKTPTGPAPAARADVAVTAEADPLAYIQAQTTRAHGLGRAVRS